MGTDVVTMGIALPVITGTAVPDIGTAVVLMMGMDAVPAGMELEYIIPGGMEPCIGGGTEPTKGATDPCCGPEVRDFDGRGGRKASCA
jgi:hypothetical protein